VNRSVGTGPSLPQRRPNLFGRYLGTFLLLFVLALLVSSLAVRPIAQATAAPAPGAVHGSLALGAIALRAAAPVPARPGVEALAGNLTVVGKVTIAPTTGWLQSKP